MDATAPFSENARAKWYGRSIATVRRTIEHVMPCRAMPGHAARRCPMVVTQFCQRWAGPQGKPFLLHCLALFCARTAKLAAPQHTVCLTKAVLRCTGFGFAAEGTL